MANNILSLLDFERINTLLEGFNKITGFVTAILDLDGNVLSKSGWRHLCTHYHRINPLTAGLCKISDTELANNMAAGEKYHCYKCLNGLFNVAVPLMVDGEHIANLFSGQFFFEKPERDFFAQQAIQYGFDQEKYLQALDEVPIIPEEKMKPALQFLLGMTELIVEMALKQLEQNVLNEALQQKQNELNIQYLELQQAKDDAQHSEKYLQSIINAIGDPVFVKDEHSSILLANDAFCSLFELQRNHIIGKTLAEDVAPHERDSFLAIDRQVLDNGLEKINEESITIRGGQTRIISTRKTRFIGKNNTKFLVGVIHDISRNKQVEEALRQSEANYRTLIETMPDGVYKTTHAGKIIDLNPALIKMLGYNSKEEMLNLNINEILYFDPDERARLTLEGMDKNMISYRLRRKDGSEVWVEDNGWYTFNEAGEIIIHEGTLRDITDRKKQERELIEALQRARESEDKYRSIFENSSVAILLTTTDGGILSANEYTCSLLGYTEAELCKIGRQGIMDSNDIRLSALLAQQSQTGKIKGELTFVKKDSTHFEAEISLLIFQDSDGNPRNSMVLRDLTEQKIAQQALVDSELKYRYLFENNPVPMWIFDKDTLFFLEVNDTAIHNYGYTRDEFLKMTIKDIRPPEDLPMLEKVVAGLSPDFNSLGEWRHIKKNGEVITVEIVSHSINFESRKAILVLVNDITKRKEAELQLRKLSRAVEQNPASILIADINGSIEYVNPKFTQLTGYKMEEVLGCNPRILKSGHTSQESYDELWSTILSGKEWHGELQNRKKNNEIYVESASISPIFNDQDEITHFVAVKEDITERKWAFAEINKLNEQLEARVLERTAQLASANKELESFSYSVSHDLRTPLRALDGFANMLIQDYSAALDDEGIRMLNVIISNANRMGTLIDDLLAFSRLSQQELRLTEIDMKSLVTATFNEIVNGTDKTKIDFRLHNIPSAWGDPVLMQQVWVNLIGNAVKFTSKKQERIIEIGHYIEEDYCVYYIKDNGAGFNMEFSNKLFAVFQRLHSPKEFEGTGIGLANVNRIIQRHNGSVWGEGIPGQGATFFFSLPDKTKSPASK